MMIMSLEYIEDCVDKIRIEAKGADGTAKAVREPELERREEKSEISKCDDKMLAP